jgi:nicotinamidase-related amidase
LADRQDKDKANRVATRRTPPPEAIWRREIRRRIQIYRKAACSDGSTNSKTDPEIQRANPPDDLEQSESR